MIVSLNLKQSQLHGIRSWLGLLCAIALLALGLGAGANTKIWQCGVADDSSAEFGALPKSGASPLVASANAAGVLDARTIPIGLHGDVAPRLDISFRLKVKPAFGAQFSFKLLNAPSSGAQMAVFSNGLMAGIIQMWGTDGTSSPYRWRKTYRLYIPAEMLQAGANRLRLEALHPIWSDASADSRVWWEWDYLKLEALDRPATEPIHGSLAYLGTTLKHGGFLVNDDTLKLARTVLPWMGIAYSGNTIRADFWADVAGDQPRRLEYLKLLRDFNMTVVVDNVSGSHFHNDANGHMPEAVKQNLDDFLKRYGDLFQYYELGNEPCMFGGGFAETIELARYLNRVKPAHLRLVAPGWAYGGGKGTPTNWDADVNMRRQVEALCQMTNGHSYGYSYADNRGGSFVEDLQTFGGVEDGWPREYLNTETGTNNWHSEENGPRLASSQPHVQAFDRILRAHLSVVSRTMQHAAIFDDFGLFKMPAGFDDLTTLTAYPGQNGEDSRLQTYRRLALAYATHGAPLPYTYLNRADVQGRHLYFRAVDTSALPRLPGSGGTSQKILLNFVSFENTPCRMRVRVTLPRAGRYAAERFGPGQTYAEAHSSLTLSAAPSLDLDVSLPPREAVQYILTPPSSVSRANRTSDVRTDLPKPPLWVEAHGGNGSAHVAWAASDGARGYEVERSDGFLGAWRRVAGAVTATTFDDSGLTNGGVYLYRVISRYAKGESQPSDPGGALPMAPPAAPSGVAATAADGMVSMQWAAVSGATGYTVRRAAETGGDYVTIASAVPGSAFSDENAKNGVTYRYVVAASNPAGESPNSAPVTARCSGSALPDPWLQTDIGSVGKMGGASTTQDGATFTVRGAGTDIWGPADAFHFVYRSLTGNGTIAAHLVSSTATDDWSKAGVVLRASLEPGAIMAFAAVTTGRGSGCTIRSKSGGECEWTGSDKKSWVRLVRKGETLSAFVSDDGERWEARGSVQAALPANLFAGLGVCSHNNGTLNTSLFDHVTITQE